MNDYEVRQTLKVLWRANGFLSGLAQDISRLAPDRATICMAFAESLAEEARRITPPTFQDNHPPDKQPTPPSNNVPSS